MAVIGLFLPGRRFIPEVRKASFLGRKAGTVDVPNRSAISPANTAVMTVSRLAVWTMEDGRVPNWHAGKRE